jgi:predicted CopG family antitoxin
MSLTTIPVSTEVRERLKRIASKGETYDKVLRRLIEVAEARMLYERERRILETEEFVPLDEA